MAPGCLDEFVEVMCLPGPSQYAPEPCESPIGHLFDDSSIFDVEHRGQLGGPQVPHLLVKRGGAGERWFRTFTRMFFSHRECQGSPVTVLLMHVGQATKKWLAVAREISLAATTFLFSDRCASARPFPEPLWTATRRSPKCSGSWLRSSRIRYEWKSPSPPG